MGRSEIAGDTSGDRTRVREFEEQLVKAARVYAMRQKTGVAELPDVTAPAIAAFEDMMLEQAVVPVRSNERDVEYVARAFEISGSPAEFEQRLREIETPPKRGEPRRQRDRWRPCFREREPRGRLKSLLRDDGRGYRDGLPRPPSAIAERSLDAPGMVSVIFRAVFMVIYGCRYELRVPAGHG